MEEGKRVKKVWGVEVYLTNTPEYCAKQLYVDVGAASSLHHHKKKKETFIVSSGTGWLQLGDDVYRLFPGRAIVIEPGTPHRFWTDIPGSGMIILEISTHHDDDDVQRTIESRKILVGTLIPGPTSEPETEDGQSA